MSREGEFLYHEGAIAEFDQMKATAMEALKRSHGFILVTALLEDGGDSDDGGVTVISGVEQVDPVTFLAIATEGVSSMLSKAVVQDRMRTAGDDQEEE